MSFRGAEGDEESRSAPKIVGRASRPPSHGHSFAPLRTGSARARERDAPADRGRDARATSVGVRFSRFLGARQPTRMSDYLRNTQCEIPRYARNDRPKEVLIRDSTGDGYVAKLALAARTIT
jgi:hypothetical protein